MVVDTSCCIEMVVLVVLVMVEGRGGRGGRIWSCCVSKKTHLGPKRCITRRLDLFLPSLPFLSHVSYIYNLIYKLNISRYQKIQRKKRKDSLKAQMMRDMSFGPVFTAATLPVMYSIDYNLYVL